MNYQSQYESIIYHIISLGIRHQSTLNVKPVKNLVTNYENELTKKNEQIQQLENLQSSTTNNQNSVTHKLFLFLLNKR